MSESPVQVIVAAFSAPDGAGKLMDELKQGKKAGLIGIQDAAVVVKDGDGKLKITNARRRGRRGLITGGVVGGLLGLLAGPVGLMAVGGGAIGALAGRVANAPLRNTMQDIGASLTPNSSAIVAVIEHTWVAQLEQALVAEGARVVRETLAADIAAQLQAGGNVLYTAAAGSDMVGAARIADSPEGSRVSGVIADSEGVLIADAAFTDEVPEDDGSAPGEAASTAPITS